MNDNLQRTQLALAVLKPRVRITSSLLRSLSESMSTADLVLHLLLQRYEKTLGVGRALFRCRQMQNFLSQKQHIGHANNLKEFTPSAIFCPTFFQAGIYILQPLLHFLRLMLLRLKSQTKGQQHDIPRVVRHSAAAFVLPSVAAAMCHTCTGRHTWGCVAVMCSQLPQSVRWKANLQSAGDVIPSPAPAGEAA